VACNAEINVHPAIYNEDDMITSLTSYNNHVKLDTNTNNTGLLILYMAYYIYPYVIS